MTREIVLVMLASCIMLLRSSRKLGSSITDARTRLLLAGVSSLVLAAVIWWASSGLTAGGGGHPPSATITVPSSAVLSRSPYMGIAVCHPSSSACYRVGLAVWLKRPAVSVTATIAGVRSSLNRSDDRGIQMITSTRRREFIGFAKPPGIVPNTYLRTPDANPTTPMAVVKLTIETSNGKTVVTRLRAPVQAGWG